LAIISWREGLLDLQRNLKKRELIWDTSSLSHALEDYSHGAVSAYMSVRRSALKRRYFITWDRVKRALLRRHKSEYESRKLLTSCDGYTHTCTIPLEVYRELIRSPKLRRIARVVLGELEEVEREYYRVNRMAYGFSKVFKPRLGISTPSEESVKRVRRAMEELGIRVHYADVYALALALDRGATLVTGDRNLAKLAEYLGVSVIYTLEVKK